jgi:hypothetical protein
MTSLWESIKDIWKTVKDIPGSIYALGYIIFLFTCVFIIGIDICIERIRLFLFSST